jgi:beta-phosphoglucomutase-like phosphatase (HAD superfamily)
MTFNTIIFDDDGTLADTEAAHLQAFNFAFADEGLDWHWETSDYKELLSICDGIERITHFWSLQERGRIDITGSGATETIQRVHDRKAAYYDDFVRSGGIPLRDGVLDLVREAADVGVQLVVVTTTSPVNVGKLLSAAIGPDWRFWFRHIEDGSGVSAKKPNSRIYSNTLARLRLNPRECLAIEDSAKGLRAAIAAGLQTVVTPTEFTSDQDFSGALKVADSLSGMSLAELQGLFREQAHTLPPDQLRGAKAVRTVWSSRQNHRADEGLLRTVG